jgi:hypothetical protein
MSATHLSISVHKSKSTSANQQHHTERFDNKHKHTNESIDPSKSDQNINLRPDLQGTYNQRFNKIMDEHYTGRRKKDGTPWLASGKNASIKLLQISVNIGEVDDDGKPITKMSDEELVKLYKDDIYPMLEEEYGRENIVGAAIHLDESKPHLHVDVVPLTSDGRLSAKEVVGGKGKMHQNQSRWLEKMQEKRPDLNFVRKKDGVNGLELDKLKELTAIAEDKGEEKALNVLMNMRKYDDEKLEKEWARIKTADKALNVKAEKVAEQEQKNEATRDELNAVVGPLKKLSDELVKKTRDVDKRERELNERESGLNAEVSRRVNERTRERTRALDAREGEIEERANKLADERTRERMQALDVREGAIEERANKLADERTRERVLALDVREGAIEERANKLADERTRERTRALDTREGEIEEKLSAFGKVKESVINAFKSLPKMQNTLIEYIKHAKEERERKEREEKATQIAKYADSETENVVTALEKEDFESVDQHVENLEKVKDVTDEIDESNFELPADALAEKMDDFVIDESQFEVSNPSQKTL